jgi:hypothetical protein
LQCSAQIALSDRHGGFIILGALAFALDVGYLLGNLPARSVFGFDLYVGVGNGGAAAEQEQCETDDV